MVVNFGRKDDPAPPPPTRWQARLNASMVLVRQHVTDPVILRRLGEIEGALWTADADRKRLEETLVQLQPERANRELKDALRRDFEDPSAANASLAQSLQRRHEGIHGLQDRIEQLERSIEETIADVEVLAASSAQLRLNNAVSGAESDRLMDHLNEDLRILSKVHEDLVDL